MNVEDTRITYMGYYDELVFYIFRLLHSSAGAMGE